MFIKRFELFTLFGFPIRVDLSWFIVLALLTWMLATVTFPHFLEARDPDVPMPEAGTLWIMGFIGAVALFISVLLHELGHAVVAQRFGIRMGGITLFIFGGVAEMQDESPSAVAEFWVAIAGPIVSVLLAIGFGIMYFAGRQMELDASILVVVGWLGFINGLLVAFNMLPAFPLDGGRVLRAILWAIRDNMRWATKVTSEIGAAFGIGFIALGVFSMIAGQLFGGLWMAVIGLFLRGAAQMSYQQLLVRRALEGLPVRRFMKEDPITVPPEISLAQLVNEYIYSYYYKMYPVIENGRLVGCITTRKVKEIPQEQWNELTVAEVADPCSDANSIRPETDAMEAMSIMNRNDLSRLMVVEDGDLVGVIALKDLLRFLSLKIELEEESG